MKFKESDEGGRLRNGKARGISPASRTRAMNGRKNATETIVRSLKARYEMHDVVGKKKKKHEKTKFLGEKFGHVRKKL